MSSHTLRSNIAFRFMEPTGGRNKASAPFFLAMAGLALKAAVAWLDRADVDRPEQGYDAVGEDARSLRLRVEGLERRARQSILASEPQHLEAMA